MSFAIQSDTFTTTGNGATVSFAHRPFSAFSIVVNPTGTVTSWTAILEGSLDGTNFTSILPHTNAIGAAIILFSGVNYSPVLYYRVRCAALVLGVGTNIIVTTLGRE